MSYESIVLEVMARGGFSGRADAERAIEATLAAVGERLPDATVGLLAQCLPGPLSRQLLRREHHRDFDLPELYELVSERERVSPGFAREHAQVVCQAVADELDAATLAGLREALPGGIAALFTPRPPSPAPPRPVRHHARRRGTLSEGRPGSSRPLSEAGSDRHPDTKLSSGVSEEEE